METDLFSVNYDPTESKLLDSMSNVNDDEDIIMADDSLDLELDTLLLSQSTRSTSISRVPNKKTYDFQTSNGRWSEELCCKGQI